MDKDGERRLIIVGKTGNGKSATANSILGNNAFESKFSSSAVTNVCSMEEHMVGNIKYRIVDTPGLFDTADMFQRAREIQRSLGLLPKPHAFLIIMSVRNRVTHEENQLIDILTNIFGPQFSDYAIVVFTSLNVLEKGQPLSEFCMTNDVLQSVIRTCKGRVLGIDNTDGKGLQQLYEKIDNISCLGRDSFNSNLPDLSDKRRFQISLDRGNDMASDSIDAPVATSNPWKQIIIGVIGGVAIVVVIGAGVWYYRKYQRKMVSAQTIDYKALGVKTQTQSTNIPSPFKANTQLTAPESAMFNPNTEPKNQLPANELFNFSSPKHRNGEPELAKLGAMENPSTTTPSASNSTMPTKETVITEANVLKVPDHKTLITKQQSTSVQPLDDIATDVKAQFQSTNLTSPFTEKNQFTTSEFVPVTTNLPTEPTKQQLTIEQFDLHSDPTKLRQIKNPSTSSASNSNSTKPIKETGLTEVNAPNVSEPDKLQTKQKFDPKIPRHQQIKQDQTKENFENYKKKISRDNLASSVMKAFMTLWGGAAGLIVGGPVGAAAGATVGRAAGEAMVELHKI